MIKGIYPEELIALCKEHDIYFDPAKEDLEVIQQHTVDF